MIDIFRYNGIWKYSRLGKSLLSPPPPLKTLILIYVVKVMIPSDSSNKSSLVIKKLFKKSLKNNIFFYYDMKIFCFKVYFTTFHAKRLPSFLLFESAQLPPQIPLLLLGDARLSEMTIFFWKLCVPKQREGRGEVDWELLGSIEMRLFVWVSFVSKKLK